LPGALRINSTLTEKGLDNVAFLNPNDGSIVLVMVNSTMAARAVSVAEGQTRFDYTIPPASVATLVWNPNQANAWLRRALEWLQRPR
jgi:glucosylceramidase